MVHFKQIVVLYETISPLNKEHKMKVEGQKETKEQRFKRIAAARTQRVLDDLRLLGNCAKKGPYSYTREDVGKIFREVEKELKRIKVLFDSSNSRKFNL